MGWSTASITGGRNEVKKENAAALPQTHLPENVHPDNTTLLLSVGAAHPCAALPSHSTSRFVLPFDSLVRLSFSSSKGARFAAAPQARVVSRLIAFFHPLAPSCLGWDEALPEPLCNVVLVEVEPDKDCRDAIQSSNPRRRGQENNETRRERKHEQTTRVGGDIQKSGAVRGRGGSKELSMNTACRYLSNRGSRCHFQHPLAYAHFSHKLMRETTTPTATASHQRQQVCTLLFDGRGGGVNPHPHTRLFGGDRNIGVSPHTRDQPHAFSHTRRTYLALAVAAVLSPRHVACLTVDLLVDTLLCTHGSSSATQSLSGLTTRKQSFLQATQYMPTTRNKATQRKQKKNTEIALLYYWQKYFKCGHGAHVCLPADVYTTWYQPSFDHTICGLTPCR